MKFVCSIFQSFENFMNEYPVLSLLQNIFSIRQHKSEMSLSVFVKKYDVERQHSKGSQEDTIDSNLRNEKIFV